MKEDAILIEGTADRCVSLKMSHRGGKVLNNERASFGGFGQIKCYFGVCSQKAFMGGIEWGELSGIQCRNCMLDSGT